jgi:tRNA (cytosine34-C5)-methyltransferase
MYLGVGMESWLVSSRNLEFYTSYEEVDEKWRTTIRPQMFPPKPEDKASYNLHRWYAQSVFVLFILLMYRLSMRILPHHQNTGAFFVAVLEKLKPLSAKEKSFKANEVGEQIANKKRENEDDLPQNQRKKRRNEGYREDPFVFFKEEEPVWDEIKSFYEISDTFDSKCLLTRCHIGKKKNIYLTSNAVRDLVVQNQNVIKFINTGVKAFVRCDNKNMKCAFRIANDGLESIYPYIGDSRKIDIPREDLITLLMNDNPEKSPPITSLSEVIQKQVENLSELIKNMHCGISSMFAGPGSCVLIYKEDIEGNDVPLVIHISGWRGTTSLRCYMSQHSTVHLLRLLGGDISKYGT